MRTSISIFALALTFSACKLEQLIARTDGNDPTEIRRVTHYNIKQMGKNAFCITEDYITGSQRTVKVTPGRLTIDITTHRNNHKSTSIIGGQRLPVHLFLII